MYHQIFGDNACHPERSEGSLRSSSQILRFTQGCHPERSEGSLRPSSQTLPLRCAQGCGSCAQGDRHHLQMSGSAQRSTSEESASFPQEGAGSNVVSTSCPAASYISM